jgi:hypothetical protein
MSNRIRRRRTSGWHICQTKRHLENIYHCYTSNNVLSILDYLLALALTARTSLLFSCIAPCLAMIRGRVPQVT